MKLKLLITTSFLFLFTPVMAQAALPQIIPGCAKSEYSDNVCCALLMVSNIAHWILGIVGTAALLFFIYGGFIWITSAGASQKVETGRKIMTNTIIGIVIVIFAFVIVNFIITSFTGSQNTKLTGANNEWYKMCLNYNACKSMGEGYGCKDIRSCTEHEKMKESYLNCTAENQCVRFLCSGGNENVCCK